jgi:ABC-type Fe3+-hydroxamate transport system substrate-binding protein
MSLLPNKNLFIVTSALHANIGVVNMQDRVLQTIDTLENLKQKIPDALILFVDGSPHNIDEDIKKKISEYCQTIWFNTHPDIYAMASSGRKSEAEIIMLFNTLAQIKQSKILSEVKRIFKYSARTVL